MKRILIIIALILPVVTFAQQKKAAPTTYDLLIGTYTKGTSKGIYVYRFYTQTGKLAYLNEIDDVSNPSYLALSASNKVVFAVNENGINGEVSSYSFDPKQGKLAFISKQSSGGADPCYVSVDKLQKNLFVANYSSGSLAVFPVSLNGTIGPLKQLLQDEGKGVNPERQEGPHVHIAMLSPDEKYLFYTDLGTDKLNLERYHPTNPTPLVAAPNPSVSVQNGEGPRHVVFSVDKKYLYLVTEMGSAVHVYDYDGGKLDEKQVISFLPDGFKGKTAGAAVKVSADGKFLYVSNRLETNEIIIFAINPADGKLNLVDHVSTTGKNPRDFEFDPTGNFLLVANQDSDDILIFKVDKESGKLTNTNNTIQIGNPVCLKFAPAQ